MKHLIPQTFLCNLYSMFLVAELPEDSGLPVHHSVLSVLHVKVCGNNLCTEGDVTI